jgi:hypothetical protein
MVVADPLHTAKRNARWISSQILPIHVSYRLYHNVHKHHSIEFFVIVPTQLPREYND